MSEYLQNRYDLKHIIGKGGMGVVYQAWDRLNKDWIALKQVTGSNHVKFEENTRNNTQFRVALTREFQTLAGLRHPHIVSVMDYGFDSGNKPYFTMEYLENASPLTEYAQTLSLDRQLEISIEMIQAVDYLHSHGIIHRDLKPPNVLVADDSVKVLDFGLATEIVTKAAGEGAGIVGTIAYMAPEILSQHSYTQATDYWAIGVILYEIFVGKHPFIDNNYVQQIFSIVNNEPTFPDALPDFLTMTIARLLEKDPEYRLANSNELIRGLKQVIGQDHYEQPSYIRESYIKAAKFIGRDQELVLLKDAVNETLEERGSGWLIAGESGIGKSRLIDEVRIYAQVQGFTVLTGQAVTETKAPFHLWRSILRSLCLQIKITEMQASILKPIIPDIDVLLGKPISDAPILDPQSTRLRLLTTIQEIVSSLNTPTAIFLEDIQWANESLDVLRYLKLGEDNPMLLVIATYRDDEYPSLHKQFPSMTHLKLERLQETALFELCQSILGTAHDLEAVVAFLQEQTEGNVFFAVEILHALAEDTGTVQEVPLMTLPQSLTTGKITSIVNRRLDKVPQDARSLLETAAVAGRILDTQVLRRVANSEDLMPWLDVAAPVLSVKDNKYQFAHDKLREGLLGKLTEDRQQAIHLSLAQSIESIYPDDEGVWATLSEHWTNANKPEKAAEYAMKAGKAFLASGAYRQAAAQFETAIDAYQRTNAPAIYRARAEYELGVAYYSVGDFKKALIYLEDTLRSIGYRVPSSATEHIVRLIGEFILQFWHRFRMDRLNLKWKHDDKLESYEIAARTYNLLLQVYLVLSRVAAGYHAVFAALNASEKANGRADDVTLYAYMGLLESFVERAPSLAQAYEKRIADLREQVDDLSAIGQSLHAAGAQAGASASWDRVAQHHEECEAIAERIGDIKLWFNVRTGQTSFAFMQHDDWDRFHHLLATMRERNEQYKDTQSTEYIAAWSIHMAVLAKDSEQSQAAHARAIALTDEIIDSGTRYYLTAAILHYHWRYGDDETARTTADQLLDQIGFIPPQPYMFYSLIVLVEFALTQWENDSTPENAAFADIVLKRFHRYALLHSHAQAMDYLAQSWHAKITGDTQKMTQQRDRALTALSTSKMPFCEGLIHYHLARFISDAEAQQVHQRQAQEILGKLGAHIYL